MTFQKRIQRTLYNLNRKYLVKGIDVSFELSNGSKSFYVNEYVNISEEGFYSKSDTLYSEIKIPRNLKREKKIKKYVKIRSKELLKEYRKKGYENTNFGCIFKGKHITFCSLDNIKPSLKPLSFEEYTNLKAKGGKRLDIE